MSKPVIVFGAKKNASIILDILQKNNLMVYGFLEDDPTFEGKTINHVPVLGSLKDEKHLDLLGPACHAFISLQDTKKHTTLLQLLAEKYKLAPINAIHPSVILASDIKIGVGNLLGTYTSLGPATTLHGHCTLEGHVMIGHDATIHNFVYISAGSIINPGVTIYPHAHIGTGVTIAPGVTIGRGAKISPGTTVLDDVPPADKNGTS